MACAVFHIGTVKLSNVGSVQYLNRSWFGSPGVPCLLILRAKWTALTPPPPPPPLMDDLVSISNKALKVVTPILGGAQKVYLISSGEVSL